jgi:hypothetical protein
MFTLEKIHRIYLPRYGGIFSNASIALQTAYGHMPKRQMTKQAA